MLLEKGQNDEINLYVNMKLKKLIKEGLIITAPYNILLQPYQTFQLKTNLYLTPPFNKEIYFRGFVLNKNGNIYILDNYYKNNKYNIRLTITIVNKSENENIIEENEEIGEILFNNNEIIPMDEDINDFETKNKLKKEILYMRNYLKNFLNEK